MSDAWDSTYEYDGEYEDEHGPEDAMPDTPKPGPELDARIAEKVMHREVHVTGGHGYIKHEGNTWTPWSPSTSIADAWEVITALRDTGDYVGVEILVGGEVHAVVWDRGVQRSRATADTAPHAICLAALAAVEAK